MSQAPASVVVTISLPPKILSTNTRKSRWSTAEGVASHRNEARVKGLEARRARPAPLLQRAVIHCDWYMAYHPVFKGKDGFYRPLDIQNAMGSLKAAVDGFVDAGLIPNDTSNQLQWGRTVFHRGKAAKGRREVVITLAPWPEDIPEAKDFAEILPDALGILVRPAHSEEVSPGVYRHTYESRPTTQQETAR